MTEPKKQKSYWPWWTWVIAAFVLWLILFVGFLRQAYIRILEEESATLQTTTTVMMQREEG